MTELESTYDALPDSVDIDVDTAPADVHALLRRHMLADGYDLVLDLERSHGVYLYDSLQGRELLDFFGSFSTNALGFNHPSLATPEFLEKLLRAAINKPSNSDLYTVELASFVETFAQTLPEALRQHLFFIAGGALAVENAMKAAFDWKCRKNELIGRPVAGTKIIHFREAFHGRSGYTLSVTNTDSRKTAYFPKFTDWPRVTNPKLSFPLTEEVREHVAKSEVQALGEIKEALRRYPHEIAGLLIEPIQGEGGDNHFRGDFLQALRVLADEAEFLLLFDEVQTGFGTTGKWWCFEHFGVLPDVLAFGKKTQVCGIAGSRRLDEVESVFHLPGRINSTWGGNLVDMVRCRRIVETVLEEGLLARAAATGDVLLAGLRRLERRYPGKLTNARGRGLFLAFDLPDGETRRTLLRTALDCNLFALSSGERSVRFRPPLILEQAAAEEGLERLCRALDRVLARPKAV